VLDCSKPKTSKNKEGELFQESSGLISGSPYAMNSLLTPDQLQKLREHQYRSQGTSVSEVIMQPYWRWLVTKVPLWVAPNLITFVGLLINLFTSLLVVLCDPNSEGTVRSDFWLQG